MWLMMAQLRAVTCWRTRWDCNQGMRLPAPLISAGNAVQLVLCQLRLLSQLNQLSMLQSALASRYQQRLGITVRG